MPNVLAVHRVQSEGFSFPWAPVLPCCQKPQQHCACLWPRETETTTGKQTGLKVFTTGNADNSLIQKKRTQKSFYSRVLRFLQKVSTAPGLGILVRHWKLNRWKSARRSSISVLGALSPTAQSVAILRAPAKTWPSAAGPGPTMCWVGKPSQLAKLPLQRRCPKFLPFEAACAVGTQKLQAHVLFA